MICLGNGIIGACFQTPCAAPGQWPMEMVRVECQQLLHACEHWCPTDFVNFSATLIHL